jgi:hypothetical protein
MDIEDPSSKPTELRPHPSLKLVIKNDGRFCSHGQVYIGRYERSVECATCGASLDAFDALLKIAQEHENWEQNLRCAKRDVALTHKRIDELKRIEQNAVGRLKRKGVAVEDYYKRQNAAEFALATEERTERDAKKIRAVESKV